jgi:oxygen-independent coproporphyrinogen-3 oxidase
VIRIPPALLRRYDLPSARYTSYPTVMNWERAPTEAQWFEHLSATLERDTANAGCSVYVHIPFCQSLCTFCGCNMRLARNHALAAPYVTAVLQEFDLWHRRLGRPRLTLGELYLGGGTPTYLPAQELARLLDGLLAHADVAGSPQFTVEIDPRNTTRAQLEVLRQHGFRRINLGIQDFDPRVQDIVNRVQDEALVARVFDEARALGFSDIGVDLIYGLPLQTVDSIRTTMGAVARLRPERVAYFPYANVPWIRPSQRRFTEADLPEGDARHELFTFGRERLSDAGYEDVGLDLHALAGSELTAAARDGRLHRNFMGYSARATTAVLGLGVSAMSDAGTALVQNEKGLTAWETRLQGGELPMQRGHLLDDEDLRLRAHISNLLTRYATHWADADAGAPWRAEVLPRLEMLQRDGLIRVEPQGLAVTGLGLPFLRSICMAFDARAHRRIAAALSVGSHAS